MYLTHALLSTWLYNILRSNMKLVAVKQKLLQRNKSFEANENVKYKQGETWNEEVYCARVPRRLDNLFI